MDWLSIGSAALGAFSTGYNIYTNKRDYDYQKALQQQMFQREDTAVQRRVADLKAAGMNPSLAMGSQAGAGSVVARSNTNDIYPGAALDYINASQQIKGQRINNQIAEYERDIAKNNADVAQYNAALTKHQVLNNLGLANVPYIQDGKPLIYSSDKVFDHNNGPTPSEALLNLEVSQKTKNLLKTGQEITNSMYSLQNEQVKTLMSGYFQEFQMGQMSLNNIVNRYCELMNLNVNQDKLALELQKLDWSKEKFTYELLADLIAGVSDTLTF